MTRFSKEIQENLIDPNIGSSIESTVIRELLSFGLIKLYDLDNIIPKNLLSIVIKHYSPIDQNINFIGLIRIILLINDYKKYFKKSYQNDWEFFEPDDDLLFKHYNINLKNLELELKKANKRLGKD